MIRLTVRGPQTVSLAVRERPRIALGMSAEVVQRIVADPYEGPTVFTPSEDEQTIATASKTVDTNITIEAIPQNYGRLDWDGHTLKVY